MHIVPRAPEAEVRTEASTTRLWLIRHAEVEERFHGVFGGQIDMTLSRRGHEQALALAGHLRHETFDALFASPMKRVQQTLSPLLAMGAMQPMILPGLREVDFGDWTGLNFAEVHRRFGVTAEAWLDQIAAGAIPNAESGQTFRGRVEPCLRAILRARAGGRVAVFCHGGVIRMLLAILLDRPLQSFATQAVDYASVTRVEVGDCGAALVEANVTPWRKPDEV